MKEKASFSEGDLAVLELIEDPVLFSEFIRSADDEIEQGRGWHFDNYQRKMLTDNSHFVSACTGRTTGKTEVMQCKMTHIVVSNKYRKASANEILFVVQNKNQLEPVFLRLTQMFRRHALLRNFVDKNSINFSQHEIKLLNGAMIRCRIIGSTADSNIIGIHCPCILGDEMQIFSYVAWNSLMQVLTSWDDSYQMWASGVPNGMREKNVLYECDQIDGRFSRHNVSRLQSIRYTHDQMERDLKQYGGVEGDDWLHLVEGNHGSPAFSVFDRKLMKIENYPVILGLMNNLMLEQAENRFYELLHAPEPPPNDLIFACIDTGFSTDPTVITILYQHNNLWREFARYELRRIKYPSQAKIINWFDTIYRFNMIAIDAGSSGLALGQILQEDESYKQKRFDKRLVMVDFQGGVITGYDEEGKEIRSRVKPFTIQTLQKWVQNDQIIAFSMQDEDVISELERVGFTRDIVGTPKYFVYSSMGGQRGDDHILASLLTWVYGYYYNYFSPEKPSARGKYSDLAKPGIQIVRLR